MKLKDCLEIGVSCGLATVEEAIFNVEFHAINIFSYSKLVEELNQLEKEKDELFLRSGFSKDSKIGDVLAWIGRGGSGL